jgi:hypothetical protein
MIQEPPENKYYIFPLFTFPNGVTLRSFYTRSILIPYSSHTSDMLQIYFSYTRICFTIPIPHQGISETVTFISGSSGICSEGFMHFNLLDDQKTTVCFPNIVNRYFCKLLLGLSGIVISINPGLIQHPFDGFNHSFRCDLNAKKYRING